MAIKRLLALGTIVALTISVFGCANYYKITDPQTGNVYYSQEIDEKDSGAISFKDAKTKNSVTIQSSEVIEVTGDEFEAATK